MKTYAELLKMAEAIYAAMEKEIVPDLYLYMSGPRAMQIVSMMEEIKAQKLKYHDRINRHGHGGDDLIEYPEIMGMVNDFARDFHEVAFADPNNPPEKFLFPGEKPY